MCRSANRQKSFSGDLLNGAQTEIQAAPPTVKQYMAAIRMLFSWLTEKRVLAMNPAREVKTDRFSRTEGKTQESVEDEIEKLLGAVDASTHTGLRDRALLGVLVYTFARKSAFRNILPKDRPILDYAVSIR